MAFTSIGSAGIASSFTNDQASLALTTTATIDAGNLCVLIVACDNNQTTDGDEVAVTGVTDDAGNTWQKAVEFTNGQGSAQAGAVCSIWYLQPALNLNSGAIVTIALSNSTSRDAVAATTWEFSTGGANVSVAGVNSIAADGSNTIGSLNVVTANAEHLRVRGFATESRGSVDSVTYTGTWTNFTPSYADDGTNATSMSAFGEFLISTATGGASAPTGSNARDHASAYVAFLLSVAYTLTCDGGSFSLTGGDASLTLGATLALDGGSFTLTGGDLTSDITAPLDGGSVALSGGNADFVEEILTPATRSRRALYSRGGKTRWIGRDRPAPVADPSTEVPLDYVVASDGQTVTAAPEYEFIVAS
jgi:hypothetical protein